LNHCNSPPTKYPNGPHTFDLPAWKQRVTLFNVPNNIFAILDMAKVADLLVLVVSEQISENSSEIISLIKGNGMPTLLFVSVGLNNLGSKQEKEIKKEHLKFIEKHFNDETKLFQAENQQDFVQIVRCLANIKIRNVKWRENRPYVLAHDVTWTSNQNQEENLMGTLIVSGFLCGSSLDVNNLVHIPDWGDFQLKQVDGPKDPFILSKKSKNLGMEIEGENQTLENTMILGTPDPQLQESLSSLNENSANLLSNEQTWPTKEEIQEAQKETKK